MFNFLNNRSFCFLPVYTSRLFFSADDYATIEPSYWDNSEQYVHDLKELSGTFGYKNRIVVIVDDKEEIMKNFTEPTKKGKHKICGSVSLNDKQYKAEPEKVLAVLGPPDEKEISLLDAFVIAYGGKLLRSGYFLGKKGETADHNMWTGDGMGRFMDAAHGLKSEWRPFLTHKDGRNDSVYPDISLHSVEEAVRALHVVNRLKAVFEKNNLLV